MATTSRVVIELRSSGARCHVAARVEGSGEQPTTFHGTYGSVDDAFYAASGWAIGWLRGAAGRGDGLELPIEIVAEAGASGD